MSRRRIALALGATALVLLLHAIPRRTFEDAGVGEISRKEGPDKLVHVVLFAALAGAWLVAAPGRPWSVLIGSLAFGVAMEVMQSYCIAGRTGSAEDFAADTVGIAAVGLAWLGWRAARWARGGRGTSANIAEDEAQ